jgi:hypothetical protein
MEGTSLEGLEEESCFCWTAVGKSVSIHPSIHLIDSTNIF